ncbi:unnamed protein product, partial [Linum tenue]
MGLLRIHIRGRNPQRTPAGSHKEESSYLLLHPLHPQRLSSSSPRTIAAPPPTPPPHSPSPPRHAPLADRHKTHISKVDSHRTSADSVESHAEAHQSRDAEQNQICFSGFDVGLRRRTGGRRRKRPWKRTASTRAVPSIQQLVPMTGCIDASLITALVERWRPETSTFHMPVGEVTITLEDVATLSGLPIDGEAVIVDVPDREWSETCTRLLGHAPNDLSGGVVKLSWLREHFNNLPPNASVEITGQFARAYALSLIGFMLFPDRTGATVHLQYLLLLENWRTAGGYAWGAAVLAYLYREMGRSVLHLTRSSSTRGDLGGWVALLQLWAWERFPLIAPRHT